MYLHFIFRIPITEYRFLYILYHKYTLQNGGCLTLYLSLGLSSSYNDIIYVNGQLM